MKIREAINQVDILCPNSIPTAVKVKWLNTLDETIFNEVVSTRERYDGGEWEPYEDMDTVLIAASPYEDMYLYYLRAKIDYELGEYDRYNADSIMFEDARHSLYNRLLSQEKSKKTPKLNIWG